MEIRKVNINKNKIFIEIDFYDKEYKQIEVMDLYDLTISFIEKEEPETFINIDYRSNGINFIVENEKIVKKFLSGNITLLGDGFDNYNINRIESLVLKTFKKELELIQKWLNVAYSELETMYFNLGSLKA